MSDPHKEMIRLAAAYAERGDPTGWFEEFYARAGGEISKVYWADRKASPVLLSWLERHPAADGARAVAVGCGLGDDAEAMAARGYQVTAFDISKSAIAMCRQRYPESAVDYCVGDLFDPPAKWRRGFDLVYECNTIQILKGDLRRAALKAIVELAAPGGIVLVSCRSCERGAQPDELPIPLDRDEIDGFSRAGLVELEFLAYDDDQDPPVPHFFAAYRRPRR
jgi:SAM-dependent methyltransferase